MDELVIRRGQSTAIIRRGQTHLQVTNRPASSVIEIQRTGIRGPIGGTEEVEAIAQGLALLSTQVQAIPEIYVQAEPPEFTSPGLWFQTGLGEDGTGFTLWIEDQQ